MRLDHSEAVLDFNGDPIPNGPDGAVLTFKDLALSALSGPGPNENMGAEAKARCYQMSLKLLRGKHVKLTVDEAAFIKERAGVLLTSSLVYGRLCDWVEGNEQAVASDEDESETGGEGAEDDAETGT